MTKTAKVLSVAQLLILSTAAARTDRMIMPLPSSLRTRGASQHGLLQSLLRLKLVEEAPTDAVLLSWRQDEQEQRYALRLTAAGVQAVGGTTDNAAEGAGVSIPEAEPSSQTPVECGEVTSAASPQTKRASSPAGKLGQVLAAVGAGQGATIGELVQLTGWLPHTTRAALTRLKQRGYPVQLVKHADRKAYQLSQGAGS